MITVPLPKSILSLRGYNLKKFTSDLLAGVTVGLVALPLAMAFAISSGLPPQAGIYTAVVAGFLISALGGSKTQIGGPTGAFVVVVYGIVAQYGTHGLFIATILAGIMLILLGITGLGQAVKFIPRPVVIGFTNGIAVLIASTQIRDFFGLKMDKVPGEFLPRMEAIASSFHTISVSATLVACLSLLLILVFMRFVKRIPGSIVALGLGTVAVYFLKLDVETIGTRFGGIPAGLPAFSMPVVKMSEVFPLMRPAITVALLGALESLMSAVVSDRMSQDKHNPGVELVAQGIANIASPFFGGIPATGAIARTATNIRSGAQSPISGMIHAITLAGILLFASDLAQYIPLCVLAAILLVVSYNMGEWEEIPGLVRVSKSSVVLWLVTFGLTVFADLTFAVEVGMIIAALVFIQKVTGTTTVSIVTQGYIAEGKVHSLQDRELPDYVSVVRIHGPFLFGSTDKLEELAHNVDELASIVILRLRNMTALDATGLGALEDFAGKLKIHERTLVVCGAREQPGRLLQQPGFRDLIGPDNILPHIDAALKRANELAHEKGLHKVG